MAHLINLQAPLRAVCFDWGATLMPETGGPDDIPMAQWEHVSQIEGAEKCLQALHGQLPLCIATNASISKKPMIELALQRVGLKKYFLEIFCFTELGFKKDQIEFWMHVSKTLNLPLHQIAMIGDSYEQDYQAPTDFGLQAVWFNHDLKMQIPTDCIAHVAKLEDFSKAVLATSEALRTTLKDYGGKVDLEIDLNRLRDR